MINDIIHLLGNTKLNAFKVEKKINKKQAKKKREWKSDTKHVEFVKVISEI